MTNFLTMFATLKEKSNPAANEGVKMDAVVIPRDAETRSKHQGGRVLRLFKKTDPPISFWYAHLMIMIC